MGRISGLPSLTVSMPVFGDKGSLLCILFAAIDRDRGAVYKFITKPWEDKALVESLIDAFRMHEMERENRELSRRLQAILAHPSAAGG